MAWDYSDKIKDYFKQALYAMPESFLGKIEDYDAKGMHGSVECGDAIVFYIKVKPHESDPLKDRIIQARYQTFGCTSAIASSEALCAIIENRRPTPVQALGINNNHIVDFLGGMPKEKIHCSVMGAEVLAETVFDWAVKRKISPDLVPGMKEHLDSKEKGPEGKIVCNCFALTDEYIKAKIKEHNLRNIDEIIGTIKAGGGCGSCTNAPGGLYDLMVETNGVFKKHAESEETLVLREEIEEALIEVIYPVLESQQVTMDLIEINNNKVYASFSSNNPEKEKDIMKNTVERFLTEMVHKSIIVIDI